MSSGIPRQQATLNEDESGKVKNYAYFTHKLRCAKLARAEVEIKFVRHHNNQEIYKGKIAKNTKAYTIRKLHQQCIVQTVEKP